MIKTRARIILAIIAVLLILGSLVVQNTHLVLIIRLLGLGIVLYGAVKTMIDRDKQFEK